MAKDPTRKEGTYSFHTFINGFFKFASDCLAQSMHPRYAVNEFPPPLAWTHHPKCRDVRRDIITLYTHDADMISSIADDGILQHEEETQRQLVGIGHILRNFMARDEGSREFFPLFALHLLLANHRDRL